MGLDEISRSTRTVICLVSSPSGEVTDMVTITVVGVGVAVGVGLGTGRLTVGSTLKGVFVAWAVPPMLSGECEP